MFCFVISRHCFARLTQLSSAVVGHDNTINTMVNSQQSIFTSRNALDPHLHLITTLLLQPRNIALPVQGRICRVRVKRDGSSRNHPLPLAISVSSRTTTSTLSSSTPLLSLGISILIPLHFKIRNLKVRRQLELIPNLQVPTPQNRRINRQKHSLVSRLFGPLEQFNTVLSFLKQIQLQHVRIIPVGFRHFFQSGGCKGRQAHCNTHFLAGAGGTYFAVRVRKPLHCCWRYAQGDTIAVAKEFYRRVDFGHVAEDSGSDAVFGVGV
jgi:hypothetical protein